MAILIEETSSWKNYLEPLGAIGLHQFPSLCSRALNAYFNYITWHILLYFYLFTSLPSTGRSSWKAGKCLCQSLAHKAFTKHLTYYPVFHATVFQETTSSFFSTVFLTLEAEGMFGGGVSMPLFSGFYHNFSDALFILLNEKTWWIIKMNTLATQIHWGDGGWRWIRYRSDIPTRLPQACSQGSEGSYWRMWLFGTVKMPSSSWKCFPWSMLFIKCSVAPATPCIRTCYGIPPLALNLSPQRQTPASIILCILTVQQPLSYLITCEFALTSLSLLLDAEHLFSFVSRATSKIAQHSKCSVSWLDRIRR